MAEYMRYFETKVGASSRVIVNIEIIIGVLEVRHLRCVVE